MGAYCVLCVSNYNCSCRRKSLRRDLVLGEILIQIFSDTLSVEGRISLEFRSTGRVILRAIEGGGINHGVTNI